MISLYPSYTKFDETNRLGLWWVMFGLLAPIQPPEQPKVTGGSGGGRTYTWTNKNESDDDETMLAVIMAFCLSEER